MKAGYNPIHPALLIEESIQELGLTITAAADKLGISRKHLSNIIHERASVTPSVALGLESVLGGSAEVWLGIQNKFDLWKLRQSQIAHDNVTSAVSNTSTNAQTTGALGV